MPPEDDKEFVAIVQAMVADNNGMLPQFLLEDLSEFDGLFTTEPPQLAWINKAKKIGFHTILAIPPPLPEVEHLISAPPVEEEDLVSFSNNMCLTMLTLYGYRLQSPPKPPSISISL